MLLKVISIDFSFPPHPNHINSAEQILLCSFYRWGKTSPEWLKHCLRVQTAMTRWAGTGIQVFPVHHYFTIKWWAKKKRQINKSSEPINQWKGNCCCHISFCNCLAYGIVNTVFSYQLLSALEFSRPTVGHAVSLASVDGAPETSEWGKAQSPEKSEGEMAKLLKINIMWNTSSK